MMDFEAHDRAIIESLQTERDRQAALIERMAEALKPFEAMSRHHLSASDGVEAMRYTLGSDVQVLTWGAFRRARSVLEEAGYV